MSCECVSQVNCSCRLNVDNGITLLPVLSNDARHLNNTIAEVDVNSAVRIDLSNNPCLSIQHHLGVRTWDVACEIRSHFFIPFSVPFEVVTKVVAVFST